MVSPSAQLCSVSGGGWLTVAWRVVVFLPHFLPHLHLAGLKQHQRVKQEGHCTQHDECRPSQEAVPQGSSTAPGDPSCHACATAPTCIAAARR